MKQRPSGSAACVARGSDADVAPQQLDPGAIWNGAPPLSDWSSVPASVATGYAGWDGLNWRAALQTRLKAMAYNIRRKHGHHVRGRGPMRLSVSAHVAASSCKVIGKRENQPLQAHSHKVSLADFRRGKASKMGQTVQPGPSQYSRANGPLTAFQCFGETRFAVRPSHLLP